MTWSGDLVTLDTQTGVVTTVGATGFNRLNSSALTDDGRTFTISNQIGDGLLVEIDSNTGVGTQVAALGIDLDDVRGLTWDEANGRLLALSRADDSLYAIDPDTGAATLLAPLTISATVFSAGVLSPTGTFYLWNSWGSGVNGGLFEVDLTTGNATQVLPDGRIFNWMSYDQNGVLWGGTTFSGDLNIIDPVAGTVTLMGSYPATDFRGLDFILDTSIGTDFCAAAVNSSGAAGAITARGSEVAADNDLTLTASSLPPGQFGIFVVSPTVGPPVQPANSNGFLCLSGQIGRYNMPGQILQADAGGSFELQLDLSQIPTPTALVAATAGDSYSFQAWFRDGATSSNFTGGVTIDFQ